MRGGVEQGAGRGTQKEARDKVTRMDEGSEQKWNRWRREGRSAQESMPGERKRERGLVLKVEEQPVTQPEGGEEGRQRARGSEDPERGPGGGERVIIE